MRAAIVTLYADNYGNKLQNYALQTIMGSLGYETNTILIENGHRFHRIETMGDYLSRLSPCYLKRQRLRDLKTSILIKIRETALLNRCS